MAAHQIKQPMFSRLVLVAVLAVASGQIQGQQETAPPSSAQSQGQPDQVAPPVPAGTPKAAAALQEPERYPDDREPWHPAVPIFSVSNHSTVADKDVRAEITAKYERNRALPAGLENLGWPKPLASQGLFRGLVSIKSLVKGGGDQFIKATQNFMVRFQARAAAAGHSLQVAGHHCLAVVARPTCSPLLPTTPRFRPLTPLLPTLRSGSRRPS